MFPIAVAFQPLEAMSAGLLALVASSRCGSRLVFGCLTLRLGRSATLAAPTRPGRGLQLLLVCFELILNGFQVRGHDLWLRRRALAQLVEFDAKFPESVVELLSID